MWGRHTAGDATDESKTGRRGVLRAASGISAASIFGLGNARTARAAPTGGEVVWSFETEKTASAATVVDGTVYVGTGTIGNESGRVHALDVATGEERWQFGDARGGHAASTPTVVDGTVYVGSRSQRDEGKRVHALDAADGTALWSFNPEYYVSSSPTVVDGTLYVGGNDNRLFALDAATGEERWRYDGATTGDDQQWRIEGAAPPSSPVVVDDTVYFGAGNREGDNNPLLALDASTGEERWRSEAVMRRWTAPTVVEGTVFAGGTNGTLYALDAADGSAAWRFGGFGSYSATPTVVDDTAFVGMAGPVTKEYGLVFAFDVVDEEDVWAFRTEGKVYASPTVVGSTVIVGDAESILYGLDAETGEEQWRVETNGGDWEAPTVVDGTVFVPNSSGVVYAIDAGADGSSKGSRVQLGTHGHHGNWRYDDQTIDVQPERSTTEETITSGDEPSTEEDSETEARGSTESDAESDDGDDGTDGDSAGDNGDGETPTGQEPGFGVASAIAGIASAGYLLKRRLGAENGRRE